MLTFARAASQPEKAQVQLIKINMQLHRVYQKKGGGGGFGITIVVSHVKALLVTLKSTLTLPVPQSRRNPRPWSPAPH